ncbi:acyl-CoA dehydrogenase family protein [Streptomyces peucetius]|uniref:Acyl-CoA/acyl-ACP dehydrogenase n=1 Tax=Streptomyces peucetius TaxID=1950 RepID=A0ABY6I702_STRPE|nr:acyl-CoA dehydrogenase family protein [Streptomyces peucetius]UYQ62780.1 acyl-CoA/acyl-ACP dehydrogenase [Streptomyces peucetius]
MDFRLTDDQRALRSGARELLDGRFAREALRAAVDRDGRVDRKLWRELGGAGFFALRLPESEGGAGLGLPEAVLLFEEAGRALLPGPLVATHLAAGTVPGAADGTAVVTCANQLAHLVQHFDDADAVVALGAGALEAVELREAAAVRSLDPLTPLHRLPHPPPPAAPGPLPAAAVLLTAAEQLGSAARSTEEAVRHAKHRVQFGQSVGGFQAVKHLCAEMLVRTEVARAAVYAAAAVGPDLTEAAGAKLAADEAAVRNAGDCLQVLGGMGFTWEADVHLHLKRALLRARMWVTTSQAEEMHAEALAAAL